MRTVQIKYLNLNNSSILFEIVSFHYLLFVRLMINYDSSFCIKDTNVLNIRERNRHYMCTQLAE